MREGGVAQNVVGVFRCFCRGSGFHTRKHVEVLHPWLLRRDFVLPCCALVVLISLRIQCDTSSRVMIFPAKHQCWENKIFYAVLMIFEGITCNAVAEVLEDIRAGLYRSQDDASQKKNIVSFHSLLSPNSTRKWRSREWLSTKTRLFITSPQRSWKAVTKLLAAALNRPSSEQLFFSFLKKNSKPLVGVSSINLVSIFRCSSSPHNTVYARRVDPSAVACSLSSHRHSYVSLLFSSRFIA